MQMSESHLLARRSDFAVPSATGFTLLELLVVLLITSLLAGLAAPRVVDALDRKRIDNGFRLLERQVSLLRQRLIASGAPLKLTQDVLERPLNDGRTPFSPPEGFGVKIDREIQFGANGACSGGDIVLIAPGGQERRLRLDPPFCLPRQAQ